MDPQFFVEPFRCPTCNSQYLCARRLLCFCELTTLSSTLPNSEPFDYILYPPPGASDKYQETKQHYMRMQASLRDPIPLAEGHKRTDDERLVDQIFDRVLELSFQKWFCATFFPPEFPQFVMHDLSPSTSYDLLYSNDEPPASPLSDFSSLDSAGPNTPLQPFDQLLPPPTSNEIIPMFEGMPDLSDMQFPTPEEMQEMCMPSSEENPFKEFDEACAAFTLASAELQTLLPPSQIMVSDATEAERKIVSDMINGLPCFAEVSE